MVKSLKTAAQAIWTIVMIVGGTTIGAVYGWAFYGFGGAIMFSFVGLVVGALFAALPGLFLQLLQ